jgi:hypothetical protein
MATLGDMRDDVKTLLEEFGTSVTIYRATETTDSLEHITAQSTTSYTIKCDIQPISKKDQEFHSMGILGPGNAKAYFKHTYTSDDDSDISSTFTPQVGDTIKDGNDVYWRLETLMNDSPWEGSSTMLKFHIRRLGP